MYVKIIMTKRFLSVPIRAETYPAVKHLLRKIYPKEYLYQL